MYITFVDNKIQKVSEDWETAVRKLSERMAKKLFQRIAEIRAADNLKVLRQLPGPRCHPLQGSRVGQYAVDLVHPKRLILIPIFEKGIINEESVTEVAISDIVDYH